MKSTEILAFNLEKTLAYADRLVADIPDDRFAHMPHPTMNHPAWLFGHLAIYPDRALPLIGHEDRSKPDERFNELFSAGTECCDDASHYPSTHEILERFRSRHAALLEVLPEVDEKLLDQELPWENVRAMFPKVGHAVHFLFANHLMLHLGQVSAWRRAVGLGSAR